MNGGDVGAVGSPMNGRLPIIFNVVSIVFGGFLMLFLFSSDNYVLLADKSSYHMIMLISYLSILIFLWLTKSTNPGILNKKSSRNDFANRKRVNHRSNKQEIELSKMTLSLEDEYVNVLKSMAEGVDKKFPDLCHSCHIVKPPRSKHCRIMRRCVLVYDHYCPFVGNTIGMYNHAYFYMFLNSIVVAIGTALFLEYILFRRGGVIGFGIILLSAYLSIILLSVGTLAVTHCIFFIQNMTSNEFENIKRYDHFWREGAYFNPFNRGTVMNCQMRCCPSDQLYQLPNGMGQNPYVVMNRV